MIVRRNKYFIENVSMMTKKTMITIMAMITMRTKKEKSLWKKEGYYLWKFVLDLIVA